MKQRRDHVVRDPDLLRDLTTTVGRRIMPEIRKAFAFRATRFEGFKIACYDATTGGFFRPHRDNLTPSTAHRVFALTLNLNDDYSGGQLRFPEYGNQRYRPEAGTALLFSCAHLHEVLEVTAGQRFVLLSFLYAEPSITKPAGLSPSP
jgi:predicted 2-oxoglutarate/Fe(II)-dependent dioxygenase YbiX